MPLGYLSMSTWMDLLSVFGYALLESLWRVCFNFASDYCEREKVSSWMESLAKSRMAVGQWQTAFWSLWHTELCVYRQHIATLTEIGTHLSFGRVVAVP